MNERFIVIASVFSERGDLGFAVSKHEILAKPTHPVSSLRPESTASSLEIHLSESMSTVQARGSAMTQKLTRY
jgi:hypothetical protein